jgi:prepilin-type N-terminal cleavage/methylation domain-containing protein
MNIKRKQSGLTLMEMTVVVAIVALLAVFGLPAIRAFVNSLESKGPAEAMISAALSSARAIAVKEQRYAGIRFQCAYDPKGPLEAAQYMIFIKYHPMDTSYTLTTCEGCEPIKLPENTGVMDMRLDDSADITSDGQINNDVSLVDTTTFSIIFSPAGKLVIHDVQTSNKDCVTDNSSKDDVINTQTNVVNGIGLFVQDSTHEQSRNKFVIYERDKFEIAYKKGQAWSGYLVNVAPKMIYINPYTGTIIGQD